MSTRQQEISELVVKACRLSVDPSTIEPDLALFEEGGLNLDSVDALQIVVAIARDYDIEVPEEKFPELTTVARIADYVSSHISVQTESVE